MLITQPTVIIVRLPSNYYVIWKEDEDGCQKAETWNEAVSIAKQYPGYDERYKEIRDDLGYRAMFPKYWERPVPRVGMTVTISYRYDVIDSKGKPAVLDGIVTGKVIRSEDDDREHGWFTIDKPVNIFNDQVEVSTWHVSDVVTKK